HIEIAIHFVLDLVATGQVRVLHVPFDYQYVDVLTKDLPSALFEEFRASLSVRCPPAPTAGESQLKVGFYNKVCPAAETVVANVVKDVTKSDSQTPAFMLRLHFHDCFVEGCDGSILIDNGNNSERNAFGHQGVQGYNVIENAKARLESMCPGIVSCADIVAMAARDAVALSHGPVYQVETGRKDGLVSSMDLAVRMPDVQDSIQILKQKFIEKGLNDRDLVILSGNGGAILWCQRTARENQMAHHSSGGAIL
nr:peroxidase 43-like [Tanacetum cinerariifolium]